MAISLADARGIFTKKLIEVYKETSTPTSFLKSFFTTKYSDTKEVSIAVQRGFELIAVDVLRGTEGERNTFSKSTEKIFVPPFFREYLDATELDFYDRLWSSADGSVEPITFSNWLQTVIEKLQMLKDKIERTYELQCAQVFETGIVTLKNGENIDYKRKATSLVDLTAGNYWEDSSVDPVTSIEAGCNFIRTKGKAQGSVFNMILGSESLNALYNNTKFQAKNDLRRMDLSEVRMPQRNALGGVLHGQLSAGSYKVNIWTYPEFYDTAVAEGLSYVNTKKMILLPEMTKYSFAYGAVPRLWGAEKKGVGIARDSGDFVVGEYLDERNTTHIIDIKSAGLAIPVAVDTIYTAQVIAS
tara:strand:+ start:267 stop:1337 length:1071 start_codon:yes stop_codon:yes gene_type:complete